MEVRTELPAGQRLTRRLLSWQDLSRFGLMSKSRTQDFGQHKSKGQICGQRRRCHLMSAWSRKWLDYVAFEDIPQKSFIKTEDAVRQRREWLSILLHILSGTLVTPHVPHQGPLKYNGVFVKHCPSDWQGHQDLMIAKWPSPCGFGWWAQG